MVSIHNVHTVQLFLVRIDIIENREMEIVDDEEVSPSPLFSAEHSIENSFA